MNRSNRVLQPPLQRHRPLLLVPAWIPFRPVTWALIASLLDLTRTVPRIASPFDATVRRLQAAQ